MMLMIFGVALLLLAFAALVAVLEGKTPQWAKATIGWATVLVMMSSAVGLFAFGYSDEADVRKAKEDKIAKANSPPEKGTVPDANNAPGTPMPGMGGGMGGGKRGGKKGFGKKGSGKKGGKRGGKKKGGWGRRSRGPAPPLTAERAKQIEALQKAGAMMRSRGGQVTQLQLAGKEITDKHLLLLKGLDDTLALNLSAPNVTSDGLASLADMIGLTELDLTGTPIDDMVMLHLRGMKKLRKLNLTGAAITDRGVSVLGELTALTELNLSKTSIGDEGIAHLASLSSLTHLVISDTRVGDAGIGKLVGLTGLLQFEMRRTRVTDRVIDHLLKFKKAELFCLTLGMDPRSSVTRKGIGRIRVENRTCVIRF